METLIVGGGPAGIATAASLMRRGVDSLVLEQGDTVAPAWRHHYDRLHLHTNKQASGLPHRAMPGDYPKYPSRDQAFDYLDDYARQEHIPIRLDVEVTGIRRGSDIWLLTTRHGEVLDSQHVVVATGLSHVPHVPRYPSQEIYQGRILHSAEYENGESFRGRHLLVVGFGNSAGEIALDLLDHGARPHLSVRSPSIVVPRDIAGVPILSIARWMSALPPRLGDWLARPLLLLIVGNVSNAGIPKAGWGLLGQIAKKHTIPMLDIGTMAARGPGRSRPDPASRDSPTPG